MCSADGAAVVPQLALTYKLTDRIGLGIAPLITPSGGASSTNFPKFVQMGSGPSATYEPGPTRYMLTNANLVVITPTLGIGVEVMDRLRLGVSFEWGIASLSFTNAVAATANTSTTTYNSAQGDIQAVAKVHNYFIPGLTAGMIYSPSDSFDIAGWYKWSNPIDAEGDVTTTVGYYSPTVASGKSAGGAVGNTALANCGVTGATGANATVCGSGNNLHITVQQPMEAKVGFRYHKIRHDVPYDEHVRDPMAQDVFDIEADLTWANDSAFQNLQIRFPSSPTSGDGILPVNGITGTQTPSNADVPHEFHDVYGIRLGGDFNVLPDQLTIRGGGFFQSSALNPQYQNVDFMASTNFGLALGGTYRIHLSKEKHNALEVSLGFEHVFYLNETNDGPNGLDALAGTQCAPGTADTKPATTNFTCSPGGATRYRTSWAINLGTITQSINVLNVGLGYKF